MAALLALVLAAGCSTGDDEPTAETGDASGSLSGSIVVSAAASLTDTFTEIGDDVVENHPDVEITFNFGSSASLAAQLRDGAPADVAAFADRAPMGSLDDAGLLARAPSIFARNQLVIVTKAGNPDGIENLADLATVGTIALCVDTAPCGRFADRVLADAGVAVPGSNVTRGTDARATLVAVAEGDAVAGIVYVTDATSRRDAVGTVEIPGSDNVVVDYPIAAVDGTTNSALAEAFVRHVRSAEGQRVLRDAGFLAP